VGHYTSVTIGADGLGLISYHDSTNGDLKVAHCSNAACTTAIKTTLDSDWHVGGDTSITSGADGLGLISYYDIGNSALKVAHCSNVECTEATKTTLDSEGNVGASTSITIGADGLGLVSYHDDSNLGLKVAHCSNVECTEATKTTLDSDGNVGYYTSITIGADGLGLISYTDHSNFTSALKVAHCSNAACTTATKTTVDSDWGTGYYTSITIGTDGLGLISYADLPNSGGILANFYLKVLHCENAFCSPHFRRR